MDTNRKLYFFADAPHLLKNLRTAIINNKLIALPEQFIQTHQLSSCVVQFSHLEELIQEQENLDFKIAPKLNKEVIKLTRFNKMKVNKACNMLNTDVSSALNFLSEERNKFEYSTTAIFIEIVSKWFSLITSRHAALALGKKPNNMESKEKTLQRNRYIFGIMY